MGREYQERVARSEQPFLRSWTLRRHFKGQFPGLGFEAVARSEPGRFEASTRPLLIRATTGRAVMVDKFCHGVERGPGREFGFRDVLPPSLLEEPEQF